MDLNNEDHLKALRKAADSKEGKVLVEFWRGELAKLNYEDLDENLPPEQLARCYRSMKETREFIKTTLNLLSN